MSTPSRIGAYRIERLLGTGSFATVWLGHDAVLDSRVAIKVLAENWSHDLRVRERFLDEARLLRRLDHPRLVRVHGVGELPDGRPYAVLAWADGGSLRDRLVAGPLPVPSALALLGEIAAGVAVLHRHSVVHRDLTPGNILLASGPDAERVLIADLGLAKALAAASGLTARAGTPGYMAPEQDDPLAVVDPRADVFGLGRLGLRLLAEPGAAASRAGADPDPATWPGADGGSGPEIGLRAGVPAAVPAVLHRATSFRPADRYPDAAAFGAALRAAAATPSATTPSPPDAGASSASPAAPASPASAFAPATATPATAPAALPPTRATAPRRPAGGELTESGRRTSARPGPRTLRVRTVRRLGLAGAGLLALVALGTTAGDAAGASLPGHASSGPLAVVLPPGWRAAGTGWAGQYGPDGDLEPALVVSPDPARWAVDPAVPGAFVGLSASTARRTTPEGFLAERQHADCAAGPVRRTRQEGVDWMVVTYACPSGRPVIVEATALATDRAGLLYAQVVPPPGDSAFVDRLLAGVRTTPARA